MKQEDLKSKCCNALLVVPVITGKTRCSKCGERISPFNEAPEPTADKKRYEEGSRYCTKCHAWVKLCRCPERQVDGSWSPQPTNEQEWEARKRLGAPPFDKAEGWEDRLDELYREWHDEPGRVDFKEIELLLARIKPFIRKEIAAAEEKGYKKGYGDGEMVSHDDACEKAFAEGQREMKEACLKIAKKQYGRNEQVNAGIAQVIKRIKLYAEKEASALPKDTDAGPGEEGTKVCTCTAYNYAGSCDCDDINQSDNEQA